MNEQQIRSIVRSEIQAAASSSRYQLTSIPRHIHNDIDSPYALQPVLTYVGYVRSDGKLTTAVPGTESGIFPSGWSVTKTGTGTYKITHNLNTRNFIVVATCVSALAAIEVSLHDATSVTLETFSFAPGATATDENFNFMLTVVSNKNQKLPSYVLIA